MRWARRSRRARKQDAASSPLGGYQPGTWAQAAEPGPVTMELPAPESMVTVLPPPPVYRSPADQDVAQPRQPLVAPPLVKPPPAAPPVPSATVPMSMPALPPAEAVASVRRAAPPQAVTADPQGGIRLGFVDGTDIALDPNDPQAIALQKVAEVLVSKQTSPRRRWSRKARR